MPNGAHALAVLVLEPAPIEAPIKATVPPEVERSIGTAVADAVAVIGAGLEAREAHAGLTPAIRLLAGEHLGRVACLLLEHAQGDANFAVCAHLAGKRVLWGRMNSALREHYGARFDEAAIDRALDESIGWVLQITGNAVESERAFLKAMAN
jgi:hypothetical protein